MAHYPLLITARALRELTNCNPARRERFAAFLSFLGAGEWDEPAVPRSEVHAWLQVGGNRVLYSQKVDEDYHALWERVLTVNIAAKLQAPTSASAESYPTGGDLAPHVVLHELGFLQHLDQTEIHFDEQMYERSSTEKVSSLPIPGLEDEVPYKEELYLLAPSRIADVLAGRQQKLPLHMAREQAEVLAASGPILLSGEAGSGKTSVVTHWLVVNHLRHPGQTQLFVTFSERLRDKAREEFGLMLPPDAREHQTRFLTYRELLLEILMQGGVPPPRPDREMDFERYAREYAQKVPRELDSVLVWDEIRSVLKGGVTGGTHQLLEFETYEQLSEARGRCKTPKELRRQYYEEAEQYETYLVHNDLWDAVDLAQKCLSVADQARRYDRIACDEVQDLAPAEITLLLRLLRDKRLENVFFTGDIAQVINPSGFSWGRLKGALGQISRDVEVHDARVLRINFRSSSDIVELVNSVLAVRRQVLDDEVSAQHQTSFIRGPVGPMVLSASPLTALVETRSSPETRLVLVKNQKEKLKLQEALGDAKEFVSLLTVEEAKGLEWEGALLWNFFVPRHERLSKNDWEALFVPARRPELVKRLQTGAKNPYALTYEFNLLHVGLTRARRLLFVYDDNPIRGIRALGTEVAENIPEASVDVFRGHWETKPPSAKDLRDLASRLLERDREQALRFFRLAASEYEREGRYPEAAACYEAAGAFQLAAGCHRLAKDHASELRALALEAESKNDWKMAGSRWREHADLLEKAGNPLASEGYRRALSAYQRGGDASLVPEVALERARSLPDERCAERGPLFLEAATYAEEQKDYDRALSALRSAIRDGEGLRQSGLRGLGGQPIVAWLADCYLRMAGVHKELGKFHEAAIAAREAAGLWGVARRDADEVQKRILKERSEDALASALTWNIRAGDMEAAAAVRRQLYDSVKSNLQKFKTIWMGTTDLMKSVRSDALVGVALEYADVVHYNGENAEALRFLREQAEWCSDQGFDEQARALLSKLVDYAENEGYVGEAARSSAELASVERDMGLPLEAAITFQRAGAFALKIGRPQDAVRMFGNGIELARQSMTPSSTGMYVLRRITLDLYVGSFPPDEVLPWVETAAEEFAREMEEAERRLAGIIQHLDDEIASLRIDLTTLTGPAREEREKNLRRQLLAKGWTLFCLARSAYLTQTKGGGEQWRAVILEASSKASAAFEESGNIETRDKVAKALHA